MKISAIIPAAGKGRRMGGSISKQFLSVNRKPVLIYTLEMISSLKIIDEIILVLPEDKVAWGEKEIKRKYRINKILKIIKGGKERQDSVYEGLKEVDKNSDVVVVHDGVRPFFYPEIIKEAIPFLKVFDGVIEALPVHDTVKEVSGKGIVLKTLEREKLYRAQTPQIFNYSILKKAFVCAFDKKYYATDEAGLVESVGGKIKILEGSRYNIKITNKDDLLLAKVIIKNKIFV